MRVPPILGTVLFLCCVSSPHVYSAPEAEAPPPLSEICKSTKCREPGTIKLRTEKGQTEFEQPGLPYVFEGQVVVLPGDSFDIEIDFSEDGKTKLSLPGETPRPEHTMHIEFSQMEGDQGMMLSLKNGMSSIVKYDAFLLLPDNRSGKTSSCPVRAGLMSFEMWPHPIKQLLLTNFRKMSESDDLVCE